MCTHRHTATCERFLLTHMEFRLRLWNYHSLCSVNVWTKAGGKKAVRKTIRDDHGSRITDRSAKGGDKRLFSWYTDKCHVLRIAVCLLTSLDWNSIFRRRVWSGTCHSPKRATYNFSDRGSHFLWPLTHIASRVAVPVQCVEAHPLAQTHMLTISFWNKVYLLAWQDVWLIIWMSFSFGIFLKWMPYF